MKSAALALLVAAGLAAASAGYFALVAQGPAGKGAEDASAVRPVWVEGKWPFPMDHKRLERDALRLAILALIQDRQLSAVSTRETDWVG